MGVHREKKDVGRNDRSPHDNQCLKIGPLFFCWAKANASKYFGDFLLIINCYFFFLLKNLSQNFQTRHLNLNISKSKV